MNRSMDTVNKGESKPTHTTITYPEVTIVKALEYSEAPYSKQAGVMVKQTEKQSG